MPKFPPLYECSVCGNAVKISHGSDGDMIQSYKCGHDGALIYANRKVTLRGIGKLDNMHAPVREAIKITMTVREFMCALTGRSV
jgi:hypothetical protein